jgi:hypothetical protein
MEQLQPLVDGASGSCLNRVGVDLEPSPPRRLAVANGEIVVDPIGQGPPMLALAPGAWVGADAARGPTFHPNTRTRPSPSIPCIARARSMGRLDLRRYPVRVSPGQSPSARTRYRFQCRHHAAHRPPSDENRQVIRSFHLSGDLL